MDTAIKTMQKSLKEGKNVIIDTLNISQEHIELLIEELQKLGIIDNILLWPFQGSDTEKP